MRAAQLGGEPAVEPTSTTGTLLLGKNRFGYGGPVNAPGEVGDVLAALSRLGVAPTTDDEVQELAEVVAVLVAWGQRAERIAGAAAPDEPSP